MPTNVEDVPEDLIVEFDVFDPRITAEADTFQELARGLSDRGPILYSKSYGGHWIITGYQDVWRVLRDPATFSSWPNSLVNAGQGKFLPLEADPPDHTAYRKVLNPLFTARRMRALEREIRTRVNDLIDEFVEAGEADFVEAFARDLPTTVFMALMGLPMEDTPLFADWTHKALVGDPTGTEEESNAVRAQVAVEIKEYFSKVIAERRGEELTDASDVTSVVINTPITIGGEERLLTEDELQRLFFIVMIGGLHTVQGSLCWGLLHLARNPEVRDRIVQDPSRARDAVEEVMRMEAAVMPGRRATKDTDIAGQHINEGDQLLLIFYTANHDARHFDDPETFNIDRANNADHLSFSNGRHRCIGAHLAREELRIAFEEIHKRIPDYEVLDGSLWHPSQTRGALALPIKFTPGERLKVGA